MLDIVVTGAGLITLPIQAYDVPIKAVLDTGSQVNAISAAALAKFGLRSLEVCETNITLRMADGSTSTARKEVVLPLCIGSKTYDVRFVIIDTFPFEVLLGLEFILDSEVKLLTGEKELWIGSACFPLPRPLHKPRETPLFALEMFKVPPHSEVAVTLHALDRPSKLLMVSKAQAASDLGLLVANSLDEGNDGVHVRLANPTSSEVTVPAGVIIAQAEPLAPKDAVVMPLSLVERIESRPPSSTTGTRPNTATPTGRSVKKRSFALQELDVGRHLNPEQKARILNLIDTYDDIMSKHESDTGLTDLATHEIDTGDAPPSNQRPYRLSYSERSEVTKLIQEYLEAGYITESTSPWACPIVIVKKKDGTLRFCCDWRRLNKVTKRDAMPLPRIDDMIDRLATSKYFTKLDFTSGYYQVKLSEEARPKTAFVTPEGHYEWLVMGMGLTNAPATFQRLMYKVLGGLLWTNSMAYLDDIVVFSPDFEQHLKDLTQVFDKIRAAKLKIKPPKCAFAKPGIHYLGFIITPKGVECDPETTAKVAAFEPPRCRREVRSFLGLTSYYRKFIKGYAFIAKPLHNLTKDDVDFVWTEECHHAFEVLKEALVSPPILSFPDFTKPFTVTTDASGYGVGCVLKQNNSEGREVVVAYASRVLNEVEQRYSTVERECLALKYATEVFRPYLYGAKFKVITDHLSLVHIKTMKNSNGRLQRWNIGLLDFDFEVEFKSGRSNTDADTLSRYGYEPGVPRSSGVKTEPRQVDDLVRYKKDDEELEAEAQIAESLRHGGVSTMERDIEVAPTGSLRRSGVDTSASAGLTDATIGQNTPRPRSTHAEMTTTGPKISEHEEDDALSRMSPRSKQQLEQLIRDSREAQGQSEEPRPADVPERDLVVQNQRTPGEALRRDGVSAESSEQEVVRDLSPPTPRSDGAVEIAKPDEAVTTRPDDAKEQDDEMMETDAGENADAPEVQAAAKSKSTQGMVTTERRGASASGVVKTAGSLRSMIRTTYAPRGSGVDSPDLIAQARNDKDERRRTTMDQAGRQGCDVERQNENVNPSEVPNKTDEPYTDASEVAKSMCSDRHDDLIRARRREPNLPAFSGFPERVIHPGDSDRNAEDSMLDGERIEKDPSEPPTSGATGKENLMIRVIDAEKEGSSARRVIMRKKADNQLKQNKTNDMMRQKAVNSEVTEGETSEPQIHVMLRKQRDGKGQDHHKGSGQADAREQGVGRFVERNPVCPERSEGQLCPARGASEVRSSGLSGCATRRVNAPYPGVTPTCLITGHSSPSGFHQSDVIDTGPGPDATRAAGRSAGETAELDCHSEVEESTTDARGAIRLRAPGVRATPHSAEGLGGCECETENDETKKLSDADVNDRHSEVAGVAEMKDDYEIDVLSEVGGSVGASGSQQRESGKSETEKTPQLRSSSRPSSEVARERINSRTDMTNECLELNETERNAQRHTEQPQGQCSESPKSAVGCLRRPEVQRTQMRPTRVQVIAYADKSRRCENVPNLRLTNDQVRTSTNGDETLRSSDVRRANVTSDQVPNLNRRVREVAVTDQLGQMPMSSRMSDLYEAGDLRDPDVTIPQRSVLRAAGVAAEEQVPNAAVNERNPELNDAVEHVIIGT